MHETCHCLKAFHFKYLFTFYLVSMQLNPFGLDLGWLNKEPSMYKETLSVNTIMFLWNILIVVKVDSSPECAIFWTFKQNLITNIVHKLWGLLYSLLLVFKNIGQIRASLNYYLINSGKKWLASPPSFPDGSEVILGLFCVFT